MPAMTLAAVLTTAAAVSAASLNYFVVANQQQRGAASHGRPPRRRRRHYQGNWQQQQRRWRQRRQRPLAGGGVSCGSSAEETTSNTVPTQHEEDERTEEEEDCSSCHGEVAAAAVPSGGVMAAAVPDDGRPESPASPAVFNDLVLILDAPALPPAPWKLPNLPEENDASYAGGTTTDLSPPRGCDLSPGFHLSAPWSPPKGRARYDQRRSPVSNRPRTFSEYSAGPVSGPVAPPPLLHERSTSDGPGLSIVTWASLRLAGEGAGGGLRDRRTRSFTYGGRDRDLFAEWSGGVGGCPTQEESRSRGDPSRNVHLPKASGGSPSGSGKVDSGGGERVEGSSAGGPRSPLRECHRASQALPVS